MKTKKAATKLLERKMKAPATRLHKMQRGQDDEQMWLSFYLKIEWNELTRWSDTRFAYWLMSRYWFIHMFGIYLFWLRSLWMILYHSLVEELYDTLDYQEIDTLKIKPSKISVLHSQGRSQTRYSGANIKCQKNQIFIMYDNKF